MTTEGLPQTGLPLLQITPDEHAMKIRSVIPVILLAVPVMAAAQSNPYNDPQTDVPAGTMVAFTRGADANRSTDFDTDAELATTDVYLKRRGRAAIPVSVPGNGTADFTPSISPDGRKIAWTSYCSESGSLDIVVKDLLTQSVTNLTRDLGGYNERWPNWSPDGRKIVFLRQIPGRSLDLWQMNSDGSGKTALAGANSDVEDCCAEYLGGSNAVVYASKQRIPGNQQMDIYSYRIGSNRKTALTTIDGYQGTPSVEKDRWVLYRDGRSGKIARLWPYSPVTSGILQNMPDDLYGRTPSGSPRSMRGNKRIIFGGYRIHDPDGPGGVPPVNSSIRLYIANHDGSSPKAISGTSGSDPSMSETDPSWGKDGLD